MSCFLPRSGHAAGHSQASFEHFRTRTNHKLSHFGPFRAMACGDKSAPVPARAPGWIIRLCGAIKDGSARTNEIVNQGPIRPCASSAVQGLPPCAPHTPLESPLQSLKQLRYSKKSAVIPAGKRERVFAGPNPCECTKKSAGAKAPAEV